MKTLTQMQPKDILCIYGGSAMKTLSKVFALGNSNAIRLPKLYMEALSLQPEDAITMEVINGDQIVIKKSINSKDYPSIDDLFIDYKDSEYKTQEIDAIGIVGKELI